MQPLQPVQTQPETLQSDEVPISVGLDLSLTGTGVAIVSLVGGAPVMHTTLIGSKGHKDDSLAERAERLTEMHDRIVQFVPTSTLVVVERPAYSSTGGSHHDRSGLWWLVVQYLTGFNDVVEVSPGTVKKYATGKGNAGKDPMLAAAVRRYPDARIEDNNVADAAHLAAMGARSLGHPLEAATVKGLEAMGVAFGRQFTAEGGPVSPVAAIARIIDAEHLEGGIDLGGESA